MRSKKTLAKTLVFAMAVSLMPMSAHVAKAADPVEAQHVNFNGNIGVITAPTGTSKAKYWGFAKVLKNEKGANFVVKGSGNDRTYYKISDVQEIKDGQVDISEFFGKKVIVAFGSVDTFAAVTTESEPDPNWKIKEIKPADKTFAIGYVAKVGDKFGKLSATADGTVIKSKYGALAAYKLENKEVKALDPNTNEALYEVKQGEGNWMAIKKGNAGEASKVYYLEDFSDDHTNPKFRMLTQNGSTLHFRLKATEDTWPGDEKKVVFKKQPKAPKITLDTTKETTNIKGGMKVMFDADASDSANNNEKQIEDAAKRVDFKTLGIDTIEGGKTGALTVSVKEGKGKIESKEVILKLTRPSDITLKTTDDGLKGNAKNEAESQKVTLVDNKLAIRLKVAYDLSKGAELVNMSSDTDYEYYLEHTDGANGEGTPKWKKIKRTKKVKKPTVVALKYSEAAKPYTFGGSESKLHIRVAGEKQNGNSVTLASKTKTILLKLAGVQQTMTVADGSSGAVSVQNGSAENPSAEITGTKEKVYKLKMTMANRQKVKSPRIKVTEKVSGISVKALKFSNSHEAIVELKVSKTALKAITASDQNLTFEYTAESLKNKPVKVTFKK